jgi:hypothetical protein
MGVLLFRFIETLTFLGDVPVLGNIRPLLTGGMLLIVLLVLPGGLGQLVYSLRDRYLRRVAERRGILVPSLVADKREAGGKREDEGLLTAALGGGGDAVELDAEPGPPDDDREPEPVGAAR